MAVKVLGQSAPAATTATDVYTVPASVAAVVSTLAVCNRSATTVTYRIAVRPAGATLADAHYIVYDASVLPNGSDFFTLGITLATTDVVTVYASTADLSVSVFGDES